MKMEKAGNGHMAHYSLFMYREKLQCDIITVVMQSVYIYLALLLLA